MAVVERRLVTFPPLLGSLGGEAARTARRDVDRVVRGSSSVVPGEVAVIRLPTALAAAVRGETRLVVAGERGRRWCGVGCV